jgi:uncharacterized protein
MWRVSLDDLDAITLGAAILGTGGGGNPYIGRLQARVLWRRGHAVEIVEPDAVPDEATVLAVGGIGAPTVAIEKLRRGTEELTALRAIERHAGRPVDVIVPFEVGGANSVRPLYVGALAGLPVADADGMGRAFPELQMTTFFMYGVSPAPVSVADEKGNVVVIDAAQDVMATERIARLVCTYMGGTAGMALALMMGADLKRTGVPRTMSLARDLGRAVLEARRAHHDPVRAVVEVAHAQVLFRGKIVDVQRRTQQGFARGQFSVGGSEDFVGSILRVEFQNENLVARLDEELIAMVPDLICTVTTDEGEPVTTETLRYGLRVSILGVPAPAILRRPEALRWIGPRAFGYDLDYDRPLPGVYPCDAAPTRRPGPAYRL